MRYFRCPKARKTKKSHSSSCPKMGMAFLWLKYNLNYTKARALRVTILLGYVEITITELLYHKYVVCVNRAQQYAYGFLNNAVSVKDAHR